MNTARAASRSWRQARLGEHRLEEPSRRPDERFSGQVLLVAGLLAHQHQGGVLRPLAEDHLVGPGEEAAGPAAGGGGAERGDGAGPAEELSTGRSARGVQSTSSKVPFAGNQPFSFDANENAVPSSKLSTTVSV